MVDLQIWENKKGKKSLGTLSVPLKSVLGYPDMSTMQWYGLKDSGPDSQLHLGICIRVCIHQITLSQGYVSTRQPHFSLFKLTVFHDHLQILCTSQQSSSSLYLRFQVSCSFK